MRRHGEGVLAGPIRKRLPERGSIELHILLSV
jgi:hypothetical protein